MTLEMNKRFIERYFEAIKKDKSLATLNQFIAEQPLKDHVAGYDAVLPGYWLESDDMVAVGDKVAVRFTLHGTHKGEFMGVPPTGKRVSFQGLIIYQIKEGRIVDHWMQVDMVSFMQQIGALPAPVVA